MSPQELIHIFDYPDYQTINGCLSKAILGLSQEDYDKQSHFFHGRYENLYLDKGKLPELKTILDAALIKAGEILGLSADKLQLGFWLNIMRKGDITTLHSHDDDDELLSAVYYVQVPASAGVFKLHHQGRVSEIIPIEGRYMFFGPSLAHEVGEHKNDVPRISIGINFGLKNSHD